MYAHFPPDVLEQIHEHLVGKQPMTMRVQVPIDRRRPQCILASSLPGGTTHRHAFFLTRLLAAGRLDPHERHRYLPPTAPAVRRHVGEKIRPEALFFYVQRLRGKSHSGDLDDAHPRQLVAGEQRLGLGADIERAAI